jgi:type II secretion system protein C
MKWRRFLLAANVILVALAGWMIVKIVLAWSLPEKKRISPPRASQEEAGQGSGYGEGQRGPGQYREIVQKDIFKTTRDAPKQRKEEARTEKEIMMTDLNLTLKGTIVGENQESYAIIMMGEKKTEDLFYLNDSVMGARIVKILNDKVIINLNGREEALLLTYEGGPPGGAQAQKGGPSGKGVSPKKEQTDKRR